MLLGCLEEQVPRTRLEALEEGLKKMTDSTDPLSISLRSIAEEFLSNPLMRESMARTPMSSESAGGSDPQLAETKKSLAEMKESLKRMTSWFEKEKEELRRYIDSLVHKPRPLPVFRMGTFVDGKVVDYPLTGENAANHAANLAAEKMDGMEYAVHEEICGDFLTLSFAKGSESGEMSAETVEDVREAVRSLRKHLYEDCVRRGIDALPPEVDHVLTAVDLRCQIRCYDQDGKTKSSGPTTQ